MLLRLRQVVRIILHGVVVAPQDRRNRVLRDLPLPLAREKVIDSFERAYVARVLEQSGGSVVVVPSDAPPRTSWSLP